MKKLWLGLSLFIWVSLFLLSSVVSNEAEPKYGEWDFSIKEVLKIESYGDLDPAMIQRIAVHDDGRLFIFDRRHFKFFVFDGSGKLVHSFGKKGEGPGEIKMMLNFYLLKDRLVVYDMGKIHHLALDGKFIKSVPSSSSIGFAPNHFVDENRLVKIRRSFGRGPGASLQGLELYDTSTKKSIFLDGKAPEPVKGGRSGTFVMLSVGSKDLERRTSYVSDIYGNNVVWAKNDKYVIHISDLNGKKKLTFSVEGKRKKAITMAIKEKLVSRMKVRSSNMSEADLKKRIIKSIPDECSYFSQIASDKNGMIYVYASNMELEHGQEFDIFSPDGKYLYNATITLPVGNSIKANGILFKGDYLYMVVEDDEGELSIRKYRCKLPALK